MSISYIFKFEKHGQIRNTAGALDNEVWLDVGNSLGMGYFDHHHIDGYSSAFMAVIKNIQYLSNLKKSVNENKDIIVHLHEEPDIDCVASFYVVQKYLELSDADFENLFNKKVALKLLNFISSIDGGKGKVTEYPTLYALFSSIDKNKERSVETDKYVVSKGLKLLDIVVNQLSDDETIELETYDFSDLAKKDFDEEIKVIKNSVYEHEKIENVISFEKIQLWTKSGNLEEVSAAIWEDIPKDHFGYNYARKEGILVTIVPYSIKGRNGADTTRVFASINPDIDVEKKYTLRPTAEIIEQMEQMEEQLIFDRTGRYRRDRSRPRDSQGHLGKIPFSISSDPWYIKPEEDLFDAPRAESVLEYKEILEVIRNNGSIVKRGYVLGVTTNEMELIESFEKTPLSDWQITTRKLISDNTNHNFVFAELDASLICHSNRILEAYCMNLVGRSYQDSQDGRILYLDYRTCIYSSLNCTIVLVATYDEDSYKRLPIAEILNISNPMELMNSSMVTIIIKIYNQRMALLEFGRKIGELQKKKRKDIEILNDNLLSFSAKSQKESMIENQVEREIYNFVKAEFQIDVLNSSIMDEINILVNESRERLVSKFNVLSAFAVPFVLVATIFQMGIIKFDEILSLSGWNAVVGWSVIILLIVILMLLIMLLGSKKRRDDFTL